MFHNRMRCVVRCSATALWVGLAAAGCQPSGPVRVTNANMVMGTEARITADAPDRETAAAAVAAAYDALNRVNDLMSDYVADSEIGRLNRLPPGEALKLSPETYFCLSEAQCFAAMTGGAFDVTCRPLVSVWKEAGKTKTLPTEETLTAARARVGWDKLLLDADRKVAMTTAAGMEIDLGGIAKGYALDLAAHAMGRAGATSGLIDVGGDVRVLGPQAGDQPWRIGVQHPFRPRGEHFCVVELRHGAVATSGNQHRYSEIDGKRYSHILDPRTGWPAENAPHVTVIANDGLNADAWATILSVLGAEEGRTLLAERGVRNVEVMWLLPPAEEPIIHKTDGFDQYIASD